MKTCAAQPTTGLAAFTSAARCAVSPKERNLSGEIRPGQRAGCGYWLAWWWALLAACSRAWEVLSWLLTPCGAHHATDVVIETAWRRSGPRVGPIPNSPGALPPIQRSSRLNHMASRQSRARHSTFSSWHSRCHMEVQASPCKREASSSSSSCSSPSWCRSSAQPLNCSSRRACSSACRRRRPTPTSRQLQRPWTHQHQRQTHLWVASQPMIPPRTSSLASSAGCSAALVRGSAAVTMMHACLQTRMLASLA